MRGQQPGHVVYSGGKPFYVTSAGEYVAHDPAKYQKARERSRWARNTRLPVDHRVQTV